MDTLPLEIVIEEILSYNLTIGDIINVCQSSPRYQPVCRHPEFWLRYLKRSPEKNYSWDDDFYDEIARYGISPLIDYYLEQPYEIYKDFINSAIFSSLEYNNIPLFKKLLNSLESRKVMIEYLFIRIQRGEIILTLLEKGHLDLAKDLDFMKDHRGYFLAGLYLYGHPELMVLYNEDLSWDEVRDAVTALGDRSENAGKDLLPFLRLLFNGDAIRMISFKEEIVEGIITWSSEQKRAIPIAVLRKFTSD